MSNLFDRSSIFNESINFNQSIINLKFDYIDINFRIVPWLINNESYYFINYRETILLSLIHLEIVSVRNSISIVIPFYRSRGVGTKSIGNGMWFPFRAFSIQELNLTNESESYFKSINGDRYLFRVDEYFNEPFSNLDNENFNSYEFGINQFKFLRNRVRDIPMDILIPDSVDEIGVLELFQKYGNLFYFVMAYGVFGEIESKHDAQRLFFEIATELTNINYDNNFVNYPSENYYSLFSPIEGNEILMVNSVRLPHFQDVPVDGNSPDANFIIDSMLVQIISEFILPIKIDHKLYNDFDRIFEDRLIIDRINSNEPNSIKFNERFRIWLVREIFTGKNEIVNLFRFSRNVIH